jgi:hypothetical protein
MKKVKWYSVAAVILAVALVFLVSSCSTGSSSGNTPATPKLSVPDPVVESVNAATSGMGDKYYAILDITVKNNGADGTVLVVAKITQAGLTQENEIPISINHNAKQTVKLVFPLQWKVNDWKSTIDVKAIVP